MKILMPSGESRASRRVRTTRMRSTFPSADCELPKALVQPSTEEYSIRRDALKRVIHVREGAYAAIDELAWFVWREVWRKHVELAFGAKLTAPTRHDAGGGREHGTRRKVACARIAVTLSCGHPRSCGTKHQEEACRDHQHEAFPRDERDRDGDSRVRELVGKQ